MPTELIYKAQTNSIQKVDKRYIHVKETCMSNTYF